MHPVARRLFSPAWFDYALELADAHLPEVSGCDVMLATSVDGGSVRYFQEFRDGRLVTFDIGDADEAAIVIERNLDVELASLFDPAPGSRVAAGTVLCFERAGMRTRAVLPPLAHLDGARRSMPRIRGVDAAVQLRLDESPVGMLEAFVCYVDAQPRTWGFGVLSEPDLTVETTYDAHCRMSLGLIAPAEMLDCAHLHGNLYALSALSALSYTEEMIEVANDVGFLIGACSRLASIAATPGYQQWRAELRACTSLAN